MSRNSMWIVFGVCIVLLSLCGGAALANDSQRRRLDELAVDVCSQAPIWSWFVSWEKPLACQVNEDMNPTREKTARGYATLSAGGQSDIRVRQATSKTHETRKRLVQQRMN